MHVGIVVLDRNRQHFNFFILFDIITYYINSLHSRVIGSLSKTPKKGRLEVSLLTLECEIFTISPIRVRKLATHSLTELTCAFMGTNEYQITDFE